MLCFEITLNGLDYRLVRFRSDQVSVVRGKEVTIWANDSSLRAKYLTALESSPVVAGHARNGKMWIKYASLSPADLAVLLHAARELVQQIRLET
ncbi:MAG: hypothetical protein ACKOUR_01310 [Planctomycetota bacterium]